MSQFLEPTEGNLYVTRKQSLTPYAVKIVIHLLLLACNLECANTTRSLTEENAAPPIKAIQGLDDATATGHQVALVSSPSPAAFSVTASTILVFFMHEILGGSAPSERIVAGISVNTQINSNLPFSKPRSGIFPMKGGIPLVTANNDNPIYNPIINNYNKLSIAVGLKSATMIGTITVIDNEITEGQELGSSVVGKAQGFHLVSSLDGSSQTMAFTAIFHEGDDREENTISFFGVHRTAAQESLIAVVGGTGKYDNAKGYAKIQTLHLSDQYTTDGAQKVFQFTVYL